MPVSRGMIKDSSFFTKIKCFLGMHRFGKWEDVQSSIKYYRYQEKRCVPCGIVKRHVIESLPLDCSEGHTYGSWKDSSGGRFQNRWCKVCNYNEERTVG